MIKKVLLITINIIIITILVLLVEIIAYKSIFYDNKILPNYKKFNELKDEFLVDNHLYVNYQKPKKGDPIYFEDDGRSFVGENYNKSSILLLGDSYTYGLGLNKNETFSSQLSEYTKRPVFNWAFYTEGIEYSFLELKNEKNINKIIHNTAAIGKPIEYVIYTYCYNQPSRIISKNRQYRFYYLRKYGVISNKGFSILDRLYSVQLFKNKLFLKSLQKGDFKENMQNLVFTELKAIQKEVKKYFPSAQFIVLIYSDDVSVVKNKNLHVNDSDEYILNSDKWDILKKEGIEIIRTEELLGRKMTEKDIIENERTVTIHPNANAWREIVPLLSQKLNL